MGKIDKIDQIDVRQYGTASEIDDMRYFDEIENKAIGDRQKKTILTEDSRDDHKTQVQDRHNRQDRHYRQDSHYPNAISSR